jgi:hypothetical protein
MSQIIARTDQSGANDPISLGNPRIFNFSLTTAYDLYSGLFSMKRGSGSTNGITATIYNAINGGGTALTSVFIAANAFSQSFTDMEFLFSNFSLSSGTYSLVLSSTSPTGGSTNYFIKAGNFQITDKDSGTVIGSGYAIDANLTSESTFGGDAGITFNIGANLTSESTLNGALSGGQKVVKKLLSKAYIGHYAPTKGLYKRIFPSYPFYLTRRVTVQSIDSKNNTNK